MNPPSTKQVLVNFDDCADVFVVYGSLLSPAELHGLITGFLVTGNRLTHDQWLEIIYNQMGIESMPDSQHQQQMHSLCELSLQQFVQGEFGFKLLLPDDDTELSQRLVSIGAWCSGFLSGFGLGQTYTSQTAKQVNRINEQNASISSESQDTLTTLYEIAQVDHDAETEASHQQEEQQEQDYMMLVEYIRLAVITMFEYYNPADLDAKKHTNKT